MATMQEVVNYMVNRGAQIQEVTSENFTVRIPFSNGSSQLLAGVLRGDTGELLTLISPFADKKRISANRVLEMSEEKGCLYGVVSFGEFYGLATTIPLATVDEIEVEIIMQGMAYLADLYEKDLTGVNDF